MTDGQDNGASILLKTLSILAGVAAAAIFVVYAVVYPRYNLLFRALPKLASV